MEDQETEEESSVSFEVQVSGKPEPEVEWLRNGSPIRRSRKYKVQEKLNGVYSLTIVNVTSSDDGGYRCVAKNTEGTAMCEAKLVVNRPGNNKLLVDSYHLNLSLHYSR